MFKVEVETPSRELTHIVLDVLKSIYGELKIPCTVKVMKVEDGVERLIELVDLDYRDYHLLRKT